MVTDNANGLLDGLGEFFSFLFSFFECLPKPVQALIYFGFGIIIFFFIIRMLFMRG